MIKDVIVKLERNGSRRPIQEFAISVAETLNAHLTGVAFADDGISNAIFAGVPTDIVQKVIEQNKADAQTEIDRFADISEKRLASVAHRLVVQSRLDMPDAFAEMARCADLSIIMQSDDGEYENNDATIEATLFGSGRPMLVVPYIQKAQLKLDRVVCCWDGGRPAARAIGDALPLLNMAGEVKMLTIAREDSLKPDCQALEIAAHLARHDLKVDVEIMTSADVNVADTILNYVADNSVTLVVMGGYGHSRFREFVLGGVTRQMLSSMTVPVLLSH
ncbi:nucleotide-binding universal stress UspA family protein [Nitrobacteraceae bacterium AZCC 1564]